MIDLLHRFRLAERACPIRSRSSSVRCGVFARFPDGARGSGVNRFVVFPGILSERSIDCFATLRTLERAGYCAYPFATWDLVTGITPETFAQGRSAACRGCQSRKAVKWRCWGGALAASTPAFWAQRHPDLVEAGNDARHPVLRRSFRANNAWRVYEALNDHKVDAPPLPDDPAITPPVPTIALWSRNDGVIAPASARGCRTSGDIDSG